MEDGHDEGQIADGMEGFGFTGEEADLTHLWDVLTVAYVQSTINLHLYACSFDKSRLKVMMKSVYIYLSYERVEMAHIALPVELLRKARNDTRGMSCSINATLPKAVYSHHLVCASCSA